MDHDLKSLSPFEIPSIIQKASLFGGKVAQSSSTRNLSSLIQTIDIDSYGTMFIKMRDEAPIEKERPVAIRLNYRNISFHIDSKQFSVEGDTLVSTVPREAKAIALRDKERYVLPLTSRILTGNHRVEKRGGLNDFDAQIVDVSKNGLGLVLPSPEDEILLKHDHLWIRSINGVSLSQSLFGSVIYATERKYLDGKDLKVGVSLNSSIPDEIFSDLQQMCRLILRA